MPTARELLEQADALMRRNRQEAAARPPARAPAAPEAPGEPASAPAIAPQRIEPVLAARDLLPVAKVAKAVDDDFPVLTDAIDEIDVALPAGAEGEASDWLVEPTREDESVLGPAPPSVALVPPSTLARPDAVRGANAAAPAPAAVPVPPAVFAPAASTPAPSMPAPSMPAPSAPAAASARDLPPFESFLDEDGRDEPEITLARIEPIPATPAPPPSGDARAGLAAIEDLAAPAFLPGEPDITLQHPATRPASTPPAPALAPARDEQWQAMAEEIRMQVLQRIDIFTDTGLSERLGERLKPIVDRASADLVTAINQHVGELLRAYVAEAIEREIDRWRAGR